MEREADPAASRAPGLAVPDRMWPHECDIKSLVGFVDAPGDFIIDGWDGLAATMQGAPATAYQDIIPFMPFGSPKIFRGVGETTMLARRISGFLADHPNHALQVGIFFPVMWKATEREPFYLVMGRPSKASDDIVSDVSPIVEAIQTLNTIWCAPNQSQKDALIQNLLALAPTPLTLEQKFYLVQMQANGSGTLLNFPAALQGLEALSAQNHAHANYQLGCLYQRGVGVPIILEEAFRYWKLAADQGYANAQFNVAMMYHDGEGVQKNLPEAFRYSKLAADQGYKDAQFIIGLMHHGAEGTPENIAEAFRYSKLAADQGHTLAQFKIGLMYYADQGTQKNLPEALRYFKLAADQDHAGAQFNVGTMYINGEGTPENLAEALKYYKLAANQGNVEAQYTVGVMYHNGEGTPKNPAEALRYFSLAAEQGHVQAQAVRDQLGRP